MAAAKLTTEQRLKMIREYLRTDECVHSIAQRYGVQPRAIPQACKRLGFARREPYRYPRQKKAS